MRQTNPFMISAEQLAARLGAPDLKILDGSWYLPAQNRDGRAEFLAERIPGAVYFDIDAESDPGTGLPHMLPTPQAFAAAAGALGIGESDDIVVYDGPGLFSSARVWWTFRVMGAKRVRILAGGFDRWKQDGFPVETGEPRPPQPAVFHAAFDAGKVRSTADIRANLKIGEALILDARPFGRFTGEVPEPRPGLRSGHIPGSRSLPYDQLVADGTLKDLDSLREIFATFPLEPGRQAVTTCGSGVTAAIISLALESVGHANHALYDGSWAEWGQADDAPVATWE